MNRSIVLVCSVMACLTAGFNPRTKKRYYPRKVKFLFDVSHESRKALYFPELFEYLSSLSREDESILRQHGLPTDRKKRTELLEMLRYNKEQGYFNFFDKTNNIYTIMDQRRASMGSEANQFFDEVHRTAIDLHYQYLASYKLPWATVDRIADRMRDEYKKVSPEAKAEFAKQFPEMHIALGGATTTSTSTTTTTTTTTTPTTTTTTPTTTTTTPTTTTTTPTTTTTTPTTTTTTTTTPTTTTTTALPVVYYTPPESDPATRRAFVKIARLDREEIAKFNGMMSYASYKNKEQYLGVMRTTSPSLYGKYINYNKYLDKIKYMEEGAKILLKKYFFAHPEFLENFMSNTVVDYHAMKVALQSYLVEYTQLSFKAKESLKSNYRLLHYFFEQALLPTTTTTTPTTTTTTTPTTTTTTPTTTTTTPTTTTTTTTSSTTTTTPTTTTTTPTTTTTTTPPTTTTTTTTSSTTTTTPTTTTTTRTTTPPVVYYTPPESDAATRLAFILVARLVPEEITALISLVSPTKEYKDKEEHLAAMKIASLSLYEKYVNYHTHLDKIESMEEGAQILVKKFFTDHPEFVENFMSNTMADTDALEIAVQSYLVEYTQLSSMAKEDLKSNFEMLDDAFGRALRPTTTTTAAPPVVYYTPPESDAATRLAFILVARLVPEEITALISLVSPTKEYKDKEEYLAAMKIASFSLYEKYINYNTYVDKIESMEDGAKILVKKFFVAHPEFIEHFMSNTMADMNALEIAVQSYLVEYTQLSSKAKEDLKSNFEMLDDAFGRALNPTTTPTSTSTTPTPTTNTPLTFSASIFCDSSCVHGNIGSIHSEF